jgi:rare lipoprotein A (peptidoglycan hydrolase)
MHSVPFGAGGVIPRRSWQQAVAHLGAACLLIGATVARAEPLREPTTKIIHASWYGGGFARRPTASGERFDPNRLTGAHRTLPLGTKIRVTNMHNGRSVLVTINDRGPYIRNRELDLSYGAARELGMVRRGVARVRIEPAES